MGKAYYRSFAITHRPMGGITDDAVNNWVNYLTKICIWWVIITEIKLDDEGADVAGSRHMHAQLFFEKLTAKCDLLKRILTMGTMKTLSSDEVFVFKKGYRIGYDKNWEEKYMAAADGEKENSRIASRAEWMPPDRTELDPFYPDKNDDQLVGKTGRQKRTFFEIMDDHYQTRLADGTIHEGIAGRPGPGVLRKLYHHLAFKLRIVKPIVNPKILDDTLAVARQYIMGPTQDHFAPSFVKTLD